MIRFLAIAAVSLGLVACGNDENQTADTAMEEEHAADAMDHASDAMNDSIDDAAEMMETGMGEPMVDSFEAQQAAFLAEYAAREGTLATSSGLLYQVTRAGEGNSPGPRDIVEVHYEGRLVDGTIFDSSYQRDETIEFPLDRVIPGWTEGLQYMTPGAEHELVIPPELGYGSRGAGEVIPPDAVLVFRVELFNVTPSN